MAIRAAFLAAIFLIGGLATAARAQDMTAELAAYEREWAGVYYGMTEDDQLNRYPQLTDKVTALVQRYPQSAEPLIWQAITLSSFAKIKGGLKALGFAKQARDAALAATRIDEKALGAGADVALGVLYYKVPGWPIGFGNDTKAKAYLDKAIALAPDATDANFFYGDFLIEQGDKAAAKPYLVKALGIPIRPDHQYADAGRKQEVERDLAKLNK